MRASGKISALSWLRAGEAVCARSCSNASQDPRLQLFPYSSNMTQHFSISIEHSAHTAANPLANTSNTPLQLWRWPVAMVLPNSRPVETTNMQPLQTFSIVWAGCAC